MAKSSKAIGAVFDYEDYYAFANLNKSIQTTVNTYFKKNPGFIDEFNVRGPDFSEENQAALKDVFSRNWTHLRLVGDTNQPLKFKKYVGQYLDSWEVQFHTASVEAHVDDMVSGFIGLVVTKLVNTRYSKTRVAGRYDTRPLFRFYCSRGIKREKRLEEKMAIVFNPRKPHELLWSGQSPQLVMISLVKKPAKKKSKETENVQ